MAAQLSDAVALFDRFKTAYDAPSCDVDKCAQMLDQLKLRMTGFTSLFAAGGAASPTMQQELMLAREILEHAAFLSIRMRDIPAFERYVSQLKVFYNDFGCVRARTFARPIPYPHPPLSAQSCPSARRSEICSSQARPSHSQPRAAARRAAAR
jgi:hypothetical protein